MKNKIKRSIAFIISTAMICFVFAGITVWNNASKNVFAADYKTDDINAPIVYMTTEITPEALVRVYNKLGFNAEGNVAVKMSTGEPPNSNYLRPELIKDLVQSVDGTIVECNTAYGGSRSSTAMHKQVAKDHGFYEIADVDIMDEDGYEAIPIAKGTRIQQDYVGTHLKNYDSLISLAHFKGHAMAGFGGAIKNMSIGIASKEGKSYIHTSGSSMSNPWGGNQDNFCESMADATSGVVDFFDGKVVYVNVMNRISIDCDCDGNPSEPDMHDVGILASTDPVALDQACIDIVYDTDRSESGTLINRIEQRNGLHTLEHAEEIGLGSRSYQLLSIDGEEESPEPTAEPTTEPTPEAMAEPVRMTYSDGALTISNLSGSGALIHASYYDGRLTGLEVLTPENGTKPINAYKGDKFFLWESVSSMIPLCQAVTVNEGAELPEPTPEPTPVPTQTPSPTSTPEADKTLVVYFSATGSTERVANYIKNAADADIFELEPVNPYTSVDLNYSNDSSRVVREHNNSDLQNIPLVSTTVTDWSKYDTVFIGYPIWWHSASWVVYNFVKDNDFTGKTVIPFSTSASSGEVGDEVIKDMTSTGDWQEGRGFRSSASESTVRDWVDSLNLK